MDIPQRVFIGRLFIFYLFKQYNYRDFFYLFKKIVIIIIISFGNVGSGDILYQNNGFFILIFTCFCYWIQIRWKPFITEELNSLDLKASMITIITIFAGLFSLVCENSTLQTILMVVVLVLNVYFMLLFFKTYFQIHLSFAKDSKLFRFINKLVEKIWSGGLLIFFLYVFPLNYF